MVRQTVRQQGLASCMSECKRPGAANGATVGTCLVHVRKMCAHKSWRADMHKALCKVFYYVKSATIHIYIYIVVQYVSLI